MLRILTPSFGFIQNGPSVKNVLKSRRLVKYQSYEINRELEDLYAGIIGQGNALSFASGRMAFWSFLKINKIGPGDEIIITGFTCSVMVNAILRIGATPVFSDINEKTYGTSILGIEQLITSKTKLIVAQHSFGIACDIKDIVLIARKYRIMVLEDCALTLGTKINGVHVGNFGDAAIFSTDHAKPINTLAGGILYSNNTDLVELVRKNYGRSGIISVSKKKMMFFYFLLERIFSHPYLSGQLKRLFDKIFFGIISIFKLPNPFLIDDYGPTENKSDYDYPSSMPSFLAWIGIQEIRKWPQTEIIRRTHQAELHYLLKNKFGKLVLAKNEETLLRIVFHCDQFSQIKNKLSKFIDVKAFWFNSPIISTAFQLEDFGYFPGASRKSEYIAARIINIPILDKRKHHLLLMQKIENC